VKLTKARIAVDSVNAAIRWLRDMLITARLVAASRTGQPPGCSALILYQVCGWPALGSRTVENSSWWIEDRQPAYQGVWASMKPAAPPASTACALAMS